MLAYAVLYIIRLTSYYWSKDYHGISPDAKHESDMDYTKIKGNLDPTAPVHSTRIRVKTLSILHWFHGTLVIYIAFLQVGRSIDGFGLSPGITRQQRLDVENLMKKAFGNLKGDLAGTYFPLTGMKEKVLSRRQSKLLVCIYSSVYPGMCYASCVGHSVHFQLVRQGN